MASRLGARKNAKFKAVSTAPSINKTPIGGNLPPLPYPVTEDLSTSVACVPTVRFNGDPAYVLAQSSQPTCQGDAAGSAGGVKSGTVGSEVKPTDASSTVRATGKYVVRVGDDCTLNKGNCPGVYVSEPAPGVDDEVPPQKANPPVAPEPPKEQGWWAKASPWVHGTLGIASFVPGLSIVTGALDGAIYAGEGDYVGAGLAAASMIPGSKVVTTLGKADKGALGAMKGAKAAEEAAKAAKLAKELEEAAKLKKAADEAKAAGGGFAGPTIEPSRISGIFDGPGGSSQASANQSPMRSAPARRADGARERRMSPPDCGQGSSSPRTLLEWREDQAIEVVSGQLLWCKPPASFTMLSTRFATTTESMETIRCWA